MIGQQNFRSMLVMHWGFRKNIGSFSHHLGAPLTGTMDALLQSQLKYLKLSFSIPDNRHLGSFLWELSKYGAPISFSVGALNVFLFSMMSQQFRNEASRMYREACCCHWRKPDHLDSSNSTTQKQTAQTNVSSHI